MKFRQSINLLMIALFVWAFQSTAIHSQHHALEEMAECHVCHVSEHIDVTHHNNSVVYVSENIAVESREEARKVVVSARFNDTDINEIKYESSLSTQTYTSDLISVGFNATAPPIYFS